MCIRQWFCAAVICVLGWFALPSWAATGKTPGNFAVSATGAATYTIPIWAPPGPHGLQPNIALFYSSQGGGAGPLGPGWSLAGLSSIFRCNKTYAQDSAAAPVTLTYADVFCLDGKRLRLTSSSTYGQDGTTYQTEVADFSNVTAHGVAGNGPSYFVVQAKSGLIYEYGNGRNSQVLAGSSGTASAWLLDKVTDRAGNTLIISYSAPSATLTGTTVPTAISWTPSSAGSSAYQYTMQFDYNTANTPASSIFGYVGGTPVVNQDLLLDINIVNNLGATIKKYVLAYGSSPTTGATRLANVKECADVAASSCVLPTTVSYQDGQAGVSSSPTTAVSSNAYTIYNQYDLNGDGYTDLVYNDQGSTTTYVAFGSANGYGVPINTGIKPTPRLLIGDLNGSGADGILADNGGTMWYYTWNGSSFTGGSIGVATANVTTLADINGDGLPDIVGISAITDTLNHWHLKTQLNTSSYGAVRFSATVNDNTIDNCLCSVALLTPGTGGGAQLRAWDFNGDARQDLVMIETFRDNSQSVSQLLANDTNFTKILITTASSPPPAPQVISWNNDACTDLAWGRTVYVSACNGSTATSLLAAGTILTALDWDSDGRTDLIVANGSYLGVYLSTGNGLGTLQTTSIAYSPSTCNYLTFDANGDGQEDLGCWGTGSITYYLHNGAGLPDRVNAIQDGYGIGFSASYTSITRGSYTKGSGATYPEQDIQRPLYVVNSAGVSDGLGGSYTQTYLYSGARRNVQGYGFEGFHIVNVSDDRATSLVHLTYYNQLFPTSGMPIETDVYQHDGVSLVAIKSYITQDHLLDSTPGNLRHFPYVILEEDFTYDIGGSRNGQVTSETTTGTTLDNYGNAVYVAVTVTDQDPNSPYYYKKWSTTSTATISPDNGVNWCVNLPTQTTFMASSPDGGALRTVNLTPDYVHCRPSQRVIEPSSSTYAVTEDYHYDAFGNVNTVTVTGAGMSARTSSIDWGATGQFPMTVYNALSQPTQYGYDFNLGFRTSAQDPNGIITSWQDDAFGRQARETRPDGTYTVSSYSDCASSGGCLIGSHGVAVTQTVFNSDGSVQTDGTTYFDPLDRRLISNKRMLAASTYDRNEVRYDRFGRVAQEAMPCTWSSVTVACPYFTTTAYDAIGRVTQVQRPISATNSNLQTTTALYAGRTVTITDPQGKQTTKIITVAGTLGRLQDPNGYAQSFTYDGFGSLLSATDSLSNALFSASYAYGIRPFQTDATDIDLDVSSAAGQHRHFMYNALGELTNWTDAKGQAFSASYDVLSRPLTRAEPDLSTTWTWGSSAANHNIGRLQQVTANAYAENYSYDNVGRLTNRSITVPADATYGYGLAYNATTGLLDTLTYPVSTASYRLKLQYSYRNGILRAVSDANASTTVFWAANTTNPRGQVTQETLGNNVVTSRTFDSVTGWMSAQQSGLNSGAALQNESYLFDLVGNLTQRQNNNVGLTENFYYDNLYRLDHSMLNGSINLQMGYDALGNITSRSDVAGGATWTYDAARKHAVRQAGNASLAYAYDANGNMTSRNGSAITWTSYNHPSAINGAGGEAVTFDYDQNHQRWRTGYSSTNGTETTYLIGRLLEKVITAGSSDYRHYIYAAGNKVAVYSRITGGLNTVRYIREDHLGSVGAILTSTGTPYVKESFTAFGLRRSNCTWSGQPTSGQMNLINAATRQGFTGHTALGSMGLNDMNGRVEDAILGRFLSADPTPPVGGTQGWNRYAYARNNPLTYIDPSGFLSGPAQIVIEDGGDNWGDDEISSDEVTVSHDRVYDDSGPVVSFPFGKDEWQSQQTGERGDSGAHKAESKPPKKDDQKQQGNQQKTPSNPLLCDKAGIDCGNDPPQDPLCFGSFSFAGSEGDLGAVDVFAGQLVESTVQGLEVGPLYEVSVGDGGTVGGAVNQNLRTGQTSGFAFGGGKLSVGPLAGLQIGFIVTPNGSVGLYYESHRGPVAAGGGFAISSCPTQPH